METFFATPQRSDQQELFNQIEEATNNPIIDGAMCLADGLIAVLNQNRQILAINHRLLEMLGVDNPNEVLGLRPGEALGCVYADETASGCGTSPYCVTCGAAIAIVSTMGTYGPVNRTCSITVEKQGRRIDLFFSVHTSTIKTESDRFVLIFLRNITQQQYHAALERAFFHEINNTIMELLNASELLSLASPSEAAGMAKHIVSLSKRLSKEVELQRHLSKNEGSEISISRESLQVDTIVDQMQTAVSNHPSRKAKRLKIINDAPAMVIFTDLSLLMRVLGNMLINAFEADDTDQEVCLEVERKGNEITFSVWNNNYILPPVARRIFQRNFSTKHELGRGLGTFTMKLIGEQLLGGRVFFETSQKQGTRFFITLPISPEP